MFLIPARGARGSRTARKNMLRQDPSWGDVSLQIVFEMRRDEFHFDHLAIKILEAKIQDVTSSASLNWDQILIIYESDVSKDTGGCQVR